MKNRFVALLLGWLVPGLGHWYAGCRWKAVAFCAAIYASALVGWAMGDFRNVYYEPNHYQFYAEVGNGLFTLAVSAAMHITRSVPAEATAQGAKLAVILPIGDLYLMLAGLLNAIVAANAFDTAASAGKGKG